ncbi:hypothetical protein IGS61_22415 [Janthinobacterium sp. FW305-129]|uniref:hypothetical protein n=1 Tax=Janthinobacterium sp. FW305-129 TaxID=2775054 RepID=UPI001E3D1625|nr:hypothetical protein [Janthinobacterium sp. FW305-129]MCC7600258.1 hypothetical protein [Janthinobacterium sp. FW305-129]
MHEDNEFLGGKVHFPATLRILPMFVFGLHQCRESVPQASIFSSHGALKWINVAVENFILPLLFYLTLVAKEYLSSRSCIPRQCRRKRRAWRGRAA